MPGPRPPSSRILAFVDPAKLDDALRRLLPDDHDRAFIVRSVLGDGPAHHRGANYLLLSLILQLLDDDRPLTPEDPLPLPIRLPPHLAASPEAYPLTLELAALRRLLPPGELDAAVDCLTDGPPHHALTNVLMVDLLSALLRRQRR